MLKTVFRQVVQRHQDWNNRFYFEQNMTDFTFFDGIWIELYSDILKVLKLESYKYMDLQLTFFSAVLVPVAWVTLISTSI